MNSDSFDPSFSRCSDIRDYYDLELLKEAKRPIDELYKYVIFHNNNLPKYYKQSSSFKQFNNITLQLVLDFKLLAKAHIEQLLSNKLEYGTLYHLKDVYKFNSLYVEYENFPLIEPDVMNEIKNMAKQFFRENSTSYNITCLELLYFFALIVNPSYNWITIDYLSQGNKSHQYILSTDTYPKQCNYLKSH